MKEFLTHPNDKGVLYFSAASPGNCQALLDANISDVLVSFHYLKKSRKYVSEILPQLTSMGGRFMTDSGAFSIMRALATKGASTNDFYTEAYWLPYLEEYVQWLYDNVNFVFVCANMDLDKIVGREVVDKWNEKYFKPLEKVTNVIYVAHQDALNLYGDSKGLKRTEEYLRLHEYVGVNNIFSKDVDKVYALAKRYKGRIHGFALTSIPAMKAYPFFSHDSSTWLGGARYGVTYRYDGANFRALDSKKKYTRKALKNLAREKGIDHKAVMGGNDYQLHLLNLEGWKGGRDIYLRSANMKLWNRPVNYYDKRKIII